ncbi:MAG TPA: IS1595 family transposase [Anaerolineae bacterium]|nr:IS1595 family transposase [Anaerolineae bacterium]
MKKFTLKNFQEKFPNDNVCLEWLRKKLYPRKIYCINCKKSTLHHRIKSKRVYGCDYCGHQISPTAGTIFHKSSTPLTIWFYVIFQMAQTRGGISAKQIQRETGVTYKTAWRMCYLIRERLDEDISPFGGDVEVDDSYFGGKRKGKRGRGAEGKTPVLGIVKRKGAIKAVVVPNLKTKTIDPII